MQQFTELQPQDVRDHWSHEERDFTPWLAETIEDDENSVLEDTLGLDLEIEQVEKPVGSYKVDIEASVVGDNRKVIIENQLGQSDHDHLGKAIAYAAGLNADIIVWIAPQFNDEHRDAIQWLNENSLEGIDLFALRLEVWKIADSPPAVRLNPVEEPSEWKDKAKRTKDELTELGQLREDFWSAFRDEIAANSGGLRPRKPSHRHYYTNPIGKSGVHLSFVHQSEDDTMNVSLIIQDDEGLFLELKEQRESIEQDLGTEAEWNEPRETRSGNMRSDVTVSKHIDMEDRDRWDGYFDWMIDTGGRFHEAFKPRIQ